MTLSRSLQRWTTIAAFFVLIGQLLLPGAAARAAIGPEALLPPTPLVLKDGRIADVSIHVLPFDNGAGELGGDVAAGLADLTATVATDCFLTAQVIGHVSSREVADNETLAAHRLARARADAVQASLIGGGLPAKSIASVWDWQFLVREPRATLWVFRLVQGEDCEGVPLDDSAAQLVAENDGGEEPAGEATPARQAASGPTEAAPPAEVAPPAETTPPAEAARVAEAEAPPPAEAPQAEADRASGPDLAGMVGSAVAAEASPAERDEVAARPASPAAMPGSGEAADRAKRAAAAGPAADSVRMLTRPLPALSPADSQGSGGGPAGKAEVAALEPVPGAAGGSAQRAAAGRAPQDAAATQQSAAAQDPERQGKVEWGQDNVAITFATNSSYFPPGTARRLASLLGSLAAGERYRVRLEVGVSGSDTVVGATSPQEARQYNRWLAERRMSRVREWLDENASERQLEIEPAFQADDNSRRVVVRVAPVS